MDFQEFKYELYNLRKPITVLLMLLAFVGIVGLFSGRAPVVMPVVEEQTTLADEIRTGAAGIPPLSEATKAKLEKGPVFHALASYTDNGFEPSVIRIKSGETVRFTNNSSNDVWIASSGESVQLYPRTSQTCGSTDLDSCEPFSPMDFWQFRFDVSGEWEVVNNLDKSKSGKVIVE